MDSGERLGVIGKIAERMKFVDPLYKEWTAVYFIAIGEDGFLEGNKDNIEAVTGVPDWYKG